MESNHPAETELRQINAERLHLYLRGDLLERARRRLDNVSFLPEPGTGAIRNHRNEDAARAFVTIGGCAAAGRLEAGGRGEIALRRKEASPGLPSWCEANDH